MLAVLLIAALGATDPLLGQDLPVKSFNLLDNTTPMQGSTSCDTPSHFTPFWRCTDEGLEQPVAAYAPLVQGIEVRGQASAPALVIVRDSLGREFRREVQGVFSWAVGAEAAAAGTPLQPRLTLVLVAKTDVPVQWSDLAFLVPLPAPGAAGLKAQIQDELNRILTWWTTLGADPSGATHFAARTWNVQTGEPLFNLQGLYHIYADVLLGAAQFDSAWQPQAEGLLDDLLNLATDPGTGLPRRVSWEKSGAQRFSDDPVEVASQLGFLNQIAQGKLYARDDQREQAAQILERAVETLLKNAPQPDGSLAAKFTPSTGLAHPGASNLRKLDIAAVLAAWSERTGNERPRAALEDCLREFLYDHTWAGDWQAIDPGFDDLFGHFGVRGLDLWRAFPSDVLFTRITRSGVDYFLPIWQESLARGGNVAADQVRCWDLFGEAGRLDATILQRSAPILGLAARMHFKGEQGNKGNWSDVTVIGFDPKPQVQDGTVGGVPQNLLWGLAGLHDSQLADAGSLPLDEVRALFTAVMRNSRNHYGAPKGYRTPGGDSSGASLRLASGLVLMLSRLEP